MILWPSLSSREAVQSSETSKEFCKDQVEGEEEALGKCVFWHRHVLSSTLRPTDPKVNWQSHYPCGLGSRELAKLSWKSECLWMIDQCARTSNCSFFLCEVLPLSHWACSLTETSYRDKLALPNKSAEVPGCSCWRGSLHPSFIASLCLPSLKAASQGLDLSLSLRHPWLLRGNDQRRVLHSWACSAWGCHVCCGEGGLRFPPGSPSAPWPGVVWFHQGLNWERSRKLVWSGYFTRSWCLCPGAWNYRKSVPAGQW